MNCKGENPLMPPIQTPETPRDNRPIGKKFFNNFQLKEVPTIPGKDVGIPGIV